MKIVARVVELTVLIELAGCSSGVNGLLFLARWIVSGTLLVGDDVIIIHCTSRSHISGPDKVAIFAPVDGIGYVRT